MRESYVNLHKTVRRGTRNAAGALRIAVSAMQSQCCCKLRSREARSDANSESYEAIAAVVAKTATEGERRERGNK